MSVPVVVEIVVGVLVVGALVGAAILIALAAGEQGPKRFSVVEPAKDFFDKSASWAATIDRTLPGPVDRVWGVLAKGGYFSNLPFTKGPVRVGDELTYRTPLFGLTEHVVREDAGQQLVSIGTGLSVPLLLKSFGERWVLTEEGGNVRLSWTVAFTPRWIGWFPLRWTAFAVKPAMKILLSLTLR